TDPATSITGWASYDEYGTTTTADPIDGPVGYGWLGAKQRSTTTATAGLTLMGVRLYNNTRGLFTTVDPVLGGGDSAYAYPNDPINNSDLDGRRWSWRKAAKWAGVAAFGVCLVASMGACAVAGAVAFGVSAASNWRDYKRGRMTKRQFWRHTAIDGGLAFVPGGRWAKMTGRHARFGKPSRWKRGSYSSRHGGGKSWRKGYWRSTRNSWHAYRGSWSVRPRRMARRSGYVAGAYFGGSWAHNRVSRNR
ncbi:MAG: RHS repeat-associated core domain-containing protein, partial [Nocardioides sp.]